ncbi:DUF6392 family protein [Pseudomonas putida]|uniref:Pyocin immunity protein n=1 Tax=Pseudomonas putida TaxID=303 RepID=A0A6I6Y897_PSEPU|nr:DUF6392 family protein [Pseudomonas putida]QHG67856.1 hypothetical protein C2H86_27005 [Pseudomonas putida]
MNAQQLESYLDNLGRPHAELVAEGVVPAVDFIEVYPGAWTLYLEPVPGLYLCFWAENKQFESVIVSLAETATAKTVYKHKLPDPYVECVTRDVALNVLGEPFESKGPFKMPLPMGEVGGWDKFHLLDQKYPGIIALFKYDVAMNVTGVAFALEQTGFDRMRDEVKRQAGE